MTALRRLLSTAAAGASRRPRPVWTPPEAPAHKFDPVRLQETLDRLPYFVGRTPVGRNLPVYIDYKNGGSRVITIVRRIDGSQQVPQYEAVRWPKSPRPWLMS